MIPPQGSYVRQLIQKQNHGGTHLPWYLAPPSARLPHKVSWGLDAGTVFGPVHEAEDTLGTVGFISVLVPAPVALLPSEDQDDVPELVWINIYTNRRNKQAVSHHYCEQVLHNEVENWHARGWYDKWVA